MKRILTIALLALSGLLPLTSTLFPLPSSLLPLHAQTVIDMHTGQVSGKTREDYNYKAREDWQLREDSIAYDDCIIRAFNYLHYDSLQAAQNLFERALKLRPDAPGNVVVRHNIGRIFIVRRQWKDAVNILTRVLEEQPRYNEAREDRATCFIELGNYASALKDYDYLLAFNPEDEHYRLLHAIVLGQTGAKRDAIDELDELLADNAELADAYLVRAGLYTDLGNRGFARRDLDAAVRLGIPKEEIQDLYEKLK